MLDSDFASAIGQAIANSRGQRFLIRRSRDVGGGCINRAFAIDDSERCYFVKVNDTPACAGMLRAEADGLRELAASNSVRVPEPLCDGSFNGHSYLVMEYLELGGNDSNASERLGEQLARMHHHYADRHGWSTDNTIGLTPQINTPQKHWADFFCQQRLAYQFELAHNNGYHGHLLDNGMRLLEVVSALLEHYPKPSLLHGDLWSGNYGICRDGQPALFDPAVYYGDRETDIAMTELFGGFPARFYHAYWHHYPQTPGYAARKTLYNLYHILNHLNLFGGSYYSQAERMVSALLSEAR